jgi:hypothetical protein
MDKNLRDRRDQDLQFSLTELKILGGWGLVCEVGGMGRHILEHCVVVGMQAFITIELQTGVICRGTLSPLDSVTTMLGREKYWRKVVGSS